MTEITLKNGLFRVTYRLRLEESVSLQKAWRKIHSFPLHSIKKVEDFLRNTPKGRVVLDNDRLSYYNGDEKC